MAEQQRPWRLVGFLEQFDAWAERENPSQDRRVVVMDWMVSRRTDPYGSLDWQPGLADVWFGPIPGTREDDGTVVTCTLQVIEPEREVRCGLFASLSPPFAKDEPLIDPDSEDDE